MLKKLDKKNLITITIAIPAIVLIITVYLNQTLYNFQLSQYTPGILVLYYFWLLLVATGYTIGLTELYKQHKNTTEAK